MAKKRSAKKSDSKKFKNFKLWLVIITFIVTFAIMGGFWIMYMRG